MRVYLGTNGEAFGKARTPKAAAQGLLGSMHKGGLPVSVYRLPDNTERFALDTSGERVVVELFGVPPGSPPVRLVSGEDVVSFRVVGEVAR